MNMKHILVTGAYGGMGKATVDALLEAGYFVYALDRKIPDEVREGVLAIECDLTSEESVKAAYDLVRERTESLYAVVHFAGIYVLDSLVEIEEERFRRAFDINVFGAYRVNKAFLPLLKEGSRIIITTSELAPLDPLPFTGLYAITKSTLDKYAYSLRMELQLLGISVSVVRAGAVKTSLLNVSTSELDKFVENTTLYPCNAERFKKIVMSVEARNVGAERVAKIVLRALKAKKARYIYNLNNNPLLTLLNILPDRLQNYIIKKILK